jgi:hypothetical protein
MVRRVIDSELLVRGQRGRDAKHPVRHAVQVHEVLGPSHLDGARGMDNRLGEGEWDAVLDQVEAGVVRQVAVVEHEPDAALLRRHGDPTTAG